MNVSNQPGADKPRYRGYPIKERIVPVILLALAVSFTICFFGPFEIFYGNLGEFEFALSDFVWICLGAMLLSAGLITAILLPLRGRVFDVVYAIFLGITLMLFVQGNYLNFGMNSLEGDGVGGAGFSTSATVITTVVWAVVGAAILAAVLLIKQKDLVRLGMIVLMIAVIGMQLVSFLTLSLTAPEIFDSYAERQRAQMEQEPAEPGENEPGEDEEPAVLTVENLTQLSDSANCIVFIVDRFDAKYVTEVTELRPEFFDHLDGFTYYDDNISLYPRTFPGITYLLTGVEEDFSLPRLEYFKKAFTEAPGLRELKQNGYRVNVYTDSYYGYDDAAAMEYYADNLSRVKSIRVGNRFGLSGGMLRMSLYRYLPILAKGWAGYLDSYTCNQYVEYSTIQPKYSTDMKDVFDAVSAGWEAETSQKQFSFIHIAGCHMPNSYGIGWEPAKSEEEWDTMTSMVNSFAIIDAYLDRLKEIGQYENATIIITGDHGAAISDSKPLSGARLTALFVKPSGCSGSALQTSHAPVSQENLWATIFRSEGITPKKDYGKSVFDITEDDTATAVRRYVFQRFSSGCFEEIEYRVTGSAREFSNWEIVGSREVDGSIYK